MITRLVKLELKEGKEEAFLAIFNASKNLIRQFGGCQHLSLYRQTGDPQVFFTYSVWTSEAHLEAYRNSALFKSTWAQTKVLFKNKAAAWTLNEVEDGRHA